jgi:hypothetical protein
MAMMHVFGHIGRWPGLADLDTARSMARIAVISSAKSLSLNGPVSSNARIASLYFQ